MFSFKKRKCPLCGRKMWTDGNNWYCSNRNCGSEVDVKNEKKSKKKWVYRTAYDRDYRRNDLECDE